MAKSVLVFGGSSDERLVSVASAQNLSQQFNFDELWFLNDRNHVFRVTLDELQIHDRPFEKPFKPQESSFAPSFVAAVDELRGKIIFLGLHGSEGEDGTLQKLLEDHKLAFTGSGSLSSRECFNKAEAKKKVAPVGVAIAPQLILARGRKNEIERKLIEFFKQTGAIVLKPIASGSSFGLHIIKHASEIGSISEEIAQSTYNGYLAEKFLVGRELTVGVIERGGKLQALCASEVKMQVGQTFDYEGKYLGRGSTEITPADLTADQMGAAQELALKAHQALGCYGYSRTDIILTEQGPVFLETNTLPGMSKASFIPQQLKAMDISIPQFIADQLGAASARN